MYELKRLEPRSVAKILALIYGLTFGIFALFGLPMLLIAPEFDQHGQGFPKWLMLIFLVAYPILGIVFGYMGGLLVSWVYNFVARKVGGIRFEGRRIDSQPVRPFT